MSVQRLIFRQGFTAVFLGLAIGIGLTLALLRIFSGVVAGLETSHAATLAVSIALVSLAAAIACWIPARRAAEVDPVVGLRYE